MNMLVFQSRLIIIQIFFFTYNNYSSVGFAHNYDTGIRLFILLLNIIINLQKRHKPEHEMLTSQQARSPPSCITNHSCICMQLQIDCKLELAACSLRRDCYVGVVVYIPQLVVGQWQPAISPTLFVYFCVPVPSLHLLISCMYLYNVKNTEVSRQCWIHSRLVPIFASRVANRYLQGP